MRTQFTKIILIAGLALLSGGVFAGPSMKAADEPMESAPDLKKKKAGEECKSSDECQRHHMCAKTGDKNVCVQVPRTVMPPT